MTNLVIMSQNDAIRRQLVKNARTPHPQSSTLQTKPGYNINPLKVQPVFRQTFFENINYMIFESNRNVCSSNPFMQAKQAHLSRLPVFLY